LIGIDNENCVKTLNNDILMPCIGLGVYLIEGKGAVEIFREAIDIGYRHFDTASLYRNEKEVGEAIRTSNIPRKDFFVTTKIWNSDQRGETSVKRAFYHSLDLLNLDYVDLYLIHWPVPKERITTWKTLESLMDTGKVKSIGVSNFMIHHLKELLSDCTFIPAVNQIELHPYHHRKDLIDFCRSQNIQIEAYSPLTKGNLLNEPELENLSSKYNKTQAQILIRWNLQHGSVVIPKASSRNHLKENFNVFDFNISSEDMKKIDSLNRGVVVSWDPSDLS
jgi:diketogulonate reductase-like aldo/keto reductase